MATVLTIDASVFVAACQPREPGHAGSLAFMQLLLDVAALLVEPAILPVEVGAALRRAGREAEAAREYAHALYAQPHMTLLSVDERLARRALKLATECRLRGADALYVAAAEQYGSRLVTLDAEQLARAPASVRACRPEKAAEALRSVGEAD